MASDLERVREFHRKFGLPLGDYPHLLSDQDVAFRIARLDEEVNEFIDAVYSDDLSEAADALVDLVYIALGTALWMGLPWEELFAEVHRVNMQKVRVDTASESRFNHVADIAKPPGWKGPKIREILAKFMPQETP